MNTIQFNKQRTLVVAHRGLSGIEKENTNAAFVAAGNRSYYGIETDIHRTSDGHFVICHDATLERVAGVAVSVEETALADLQDIVLFDRDGEKSRADLRPCTLENYIDICKKYEKHCVLELKSDFTDEETARFIRVIEERDYLEQVTFISFVYENLLKVRRLLPTQSAQFLFYRLTDDIFDRLVTDGLDADMHYPDVTAEVIARLHGAGRKVNCWTVNDSETAERLALLGVDYITTNILE